MKIVLLRHGKTEANEKRLYCGSTNIALSETGIDEIRALKRSVDYPEISGYRVITSGLKRCDMTLAALYGDIPHEIVPEFREMDFGVFEMRSYEQMKENPDYNAWISGDNESNIAPGGESGLKMKTRVISAFLCVSQKNRDTLIVTHGGPIAVIMGHLIPEAQKNRYEWQPAPGRGYILSYKSGIYDNYKAV